MFIKNQSYSYNKDFLKFVCKCILGNIYCWIGSMLGGKQFTWLCSSLQSLACGDSFKKGFEMTH